MSKRLWIFAFALIISPIAHAGGILTNTNQHVSFLRNIARGAAIDIDGVYSNPAGLAFLSDGLYLSLNGQSAYQTRVIDATFPLFAYTNSEGNTTRTFKGTASAPIVPSVQAAYKKDKWVFSGSFALVGGGGKASFDEGLPSFDSKVMAGIYANQQLAQMAGKPVTPDMYAIQSAMDGRQYIFGFQLGSSYRINEWLGASANIRMNYVSCGYEGYVRALMGETKLVDMALDCSQSGWGVTPILGLDAKFGQWNFATKYEFPTLLNIENKTETNTTGMAEFDHGVNTPNDIPALITFAAQYEVLPTLRLSAEYHYFFDKQAKMANDKQKELKRGTNEYLAGVEWDILDRVTISGGAQYTDYGLNDGFQRDISFSCDSYSIGVGGAFKISPKIKLNIAYFWTTYSDYTKEVAASPTGGYNGTTLAGTDVFSRTNKVFGIGIDYKF